MKISICISFYLVLAITLQPPLYNAKQTMGLPLSKTVYPKPCLQHLNNLSNLVSDPHAVGPLDVDHKFNKYDLNGRPSCPCHLTKYTFKCLQSHKSYTFGITNCSILFSDIKIVNFFSSISPFFPNSY